MRDPVSWKELKIGGMSIQSRDFSCGAAALATTLTLLGRPTTEADILNEMLADTLLQRTNDSGVAEISPLSAAALQRIARNAGFKAITLQAGEGDSALASLIKLKPVICRICLYEDYLHFVVVRDIDNGWLYISDPAYGDVRVPVERFQKVWEGGDRILLAISRRPFPAWRSEAGQVYVKRDDSETVPRVESTAPLPLYNSPRGSITFSNTTLGSTVGVP